MIAEVAERSPELKRLCLRYGARRLGLFGSAATGRSNSQASDLDFVVEFRTMESGGYADAYFGLLDSLESPSASP